MRRMKPCRPAFPWLRALLSIAIVWVPAGFSSVVAADWPMWRHDAGRTAVSDQQLPAELHLHWSQELGPPAPAWPGEQDYQGKLEFDTSYQPIVVGQRIFVPSMSADRVVAFDTSTGRELWRFYADGPIRFAPAAENDRICFGSDDGFLYCVRASDGQLQWKVQGGPDRRAILGNERLISTWPVRGAPVIADGRVWFGAGIWPFMGIFLHSVDLQSGKIVWTSSGSGALFNLHQHGGADAFGGVAPQGYLAVQGDRLLVAGGLTVPAVFHRYTGELLSFQQAHHIVGKGAGGFDVAAAGDHYFNSGRLFSFTDGKPRLSLGPGLPLLSHDRITFREGPDLKSCAMQMDATEVTVTDRKGQPGTEVRYALREQRKSPLPEGIRRILIQCGSQILAETAGGGVGAIEWGEPGAPLRLVWEQSVRGMIDHVLAGDDRLFVVTREGGLHCFGAGAAAAGALNSETHGDGGHSPPLLPPSRFAADETAWDRKVDQLLRDSGKSSGIVLVHGLDDGQLMAALVRRTQLTVIAADDNADRVHRIRRQLDDAGVYGRRVHVILANPDTCPFPPYFADLVVSEQVRGGAASDNAASHETDALFRSLFHVLRPYGGAAWIRMRPDQKSPAAATAVAETLQGAVIGRSGDYTILTRSGALPGAGQWTHQYASSGNTLNSGDQLVKAPLGLLWFGGPSNRDALPRHGQGPIPQVAHGRLVIEGVDSLSARCVYTGRTLWRREFPDIGFPYKANNHSFTEQVYINNQPGANYIGSNYVTLPDSVYVVYRDECHRLDAESGRTLSTFRLPPAAGRDGSSGWGYLGVWGDFLIAGASPHLFDDGRIGEKNWNATSSRRLVVMNRYTGEVLWTHEAERGYRHNAIVPVAGKLFVIDRLSDGVLELLARRGRQFHEQPRLTAFDLRTGETLWSTVENVFGTWLGYSDTHDILIQGGRTGGREVLPDEESHRILAFRGHDGTILWDRPWNYTGPLVIAADQVISSGRNDGSVSILTGETINRRHPMTGRELPWTHTRTYGCGTVLACSHLLTFRSGAAGFFDLARDGGTGNFGGFKSSCTPNLVPADGVLSAPDYTRTCSCSYQNQTSLAMVHQPDAEIWTCSTLPPPGEEEFVIRSGINLNAPGDRMADDGTLWTEYPPVAGPSPGIPIEFVGGSAGRPFRYHSTLVSSTPDVPPGEIPGLPWVAASGFEGPLSLRMTLDRRSVPPPKKYTVRLHFAEPGDVPDRSVTAGQRRFRVLLQGDEVEQHLDVLAQTGQNRRPLVREYRGIAVNDDLLLVLDPIAGSLHPVLCGIEIALENGS